MKFENVIKMNFHGFGSVSQEDFFVIYENETEIVLGGEEDTLTESEFIELDLKKHEFDTGDSYWIFNKKSGKCMNDNTFGGCFRTINV